LFIRGGNMAEHEVVGTLTKKVIDTFGLSMDEGSIILCGNANKEHMKAEHPDDFEKYGNKITEIIAEPTYICKHPKKDSIEYVKHVLVAVRASGTGILFARTLFVMDNEKVRKYKQKNAFKLY
jgi:proline racemase